MSQVKTAIVAHAHAKDIGYPLNLSLDIHWGRTRFAAAIWERRQAVKDLLESQRHWLANRRVGFYGILVRECPSEEGEHAHQLIHGPTDLQRAFIKHTRDFLRGKKRHDKQALKWAEPYNDGKLAYILKGCTLPARRLLVAMLPSGPQRQGFIAGTQHKTCQGIIYGKRLMISQSLGPKARFGSNSEAHLNETRPLAHAA